MTSTHTVPSGEVVVFETPAGDVRVDVRLERDTVWLSLVQIAELFGRDKSVISRHLGNVFASGELAREATVAKSTTVQKEGRRSVAREIEYFNLDAILSVGYRVNSKRGTQFRIWATRTLRDHLLRGYTLHERRLRERGLSEIEQAVNLLARTLTSHELVSDDGLAVLDVVQRYTRAWRLLLEYDEDRLAHVPARPVTPADTLTAEEARAVVATLRESITRRREAGPLFGHEHSDGLSAILAAIEQTFDAKPLYPSVQARAAHLLYFIIKDHPFSDGNKRIGSLVFLDYLRRNGFLTREDGSARVSDSTMVALALLIAESDPSQKDLLIRLVLNLLED